MRMMRIGEPLRVTEEPRPIREPVREPSSVPQREGTPQPREVPGQPTREPVRTDAYLEEWEMPALICPECGGPLLERDTDFGFLPYCPRHGQFEYDESGHIVPLEVAI